MWQRKYSKKFPQINSKQIWKAWTDINNWHNWHKDIEYCKHDGAFAVGEIFTLKPRKVKAVQIILTDVQEEYSFTDCTIFPGAKMYTTHTIIQADNELILERETRVIGPLKWIWVFLVAKNIVKHAAEETEDLVEFARGIHE